MLVATDREIKVLRIWSSLGFSLLKPQEFCTSSFSLFSSMKLHFPPFHSDVVKSHASWAVTWWTFCLIGLCPIWPTRCVLCPLWPTPCVLCPLWPACCVLCPWWPARCVLCPLWPACCVLCPLWPTRFVLCPLWPARCVRGKCHITNLCCVWGGGGGTC